MKKLNIYVINPISIVGEILIKGIARGFQAEGHNVLSCDVREIKLDQVKSFNPDFIFGLGYAHLYNQEAENIIKSINKPVVHYFIDDPNSHFAHSGDLTLYDKLYQTDGIIFSWDSAYLNDFKSKAYYLPVGIDIDLYKNNIVNKNKSAKIVFTGRPLTDKREQVVAHIVKNFPEFLHIYSYEAHFNKSVENMINKGFLTNAEVENYKKCYKGFLKTEQELAEVYHNSDIILNITMEQGQSSMNYRVLEVLASGSFLLTDYVEDTANYFEENKELVFYRSLDDLSDKISTYIDNESLRSKISGCGQKKVEENHTLIHRAKEILNILDEKEYLKG